MENLIDRIVEDVVRRLSACFTTKGGFDLLAEQTREEISLQYGKIMVSGYVAAGRIILSWTLYKNGELIQAQGQIVIDSVYRTVDTGGLSLEQSVFILLKWLSGFTNKGDK